MSPLLRISQATIKMLTGLLFIRRLDRGRIFFQVCSDCWQSLCDWGPWMSAGYLWRLPSDPKRRATPPCHVPSSTSAYSIKTPRTLQSAKKESRSTMKSEGWYSIPFAILCWLETVTDPTHTKEKELHKSLDTRRQEFTGSPLGSVCHTCLLEGSKNNKTHWNSALWRYFPSVKNSALPIG